MFSGIVEKMAQVVKIETEQTNKHFTLRNPFGEALSIDQSIAHNGVCLTVVKIEGDLYTVTAMQETLRLTNLDTLQEGDWVNVERSMLLGGGRLDGHIVQGHVDQKAQCIEVKETDGSWYYRFEYESDRTMIERGYFCVDKGSVTINGVSLTVCEPDVVDNKGQRYNTNPRVCRFRLPAHTSRVLSFHPPEHLCRVHRSRRFQTAPCNSPAEQIFRTNTVL